jgi:hypothetical protein
MGQNVHVGRKISNVAASLGILRLRSDTQDSHDGLSTSSGLLTRYLALWFTHLRSAASTIVHCQLSIVNFSGFEIGSSEMACLMFPSLAALSTPRAKKILDIKKFMC